MSRLFEPSEINGLSLANRFVRSATWEGQATDEGECSPSLLEVMSKLADGGVGLIITGHAYVRADGKHSERQLGIHRDELISGLQEMVRAVHKRGGKIVVQLAHGGAYLSRSRLEKMTAEDIHELASAFGLAAVRARMAGFDGVQIFAAHGFLLSQFLCPRYNHRADEYGGDIRNRARALLEVLQSVRGMVGREYPIIVKLNSSDLVEDGLTLEDSLRVGVMLEEGGTDAIELSGGLLNLPDLLRNKMENEEDEAYFGVEARVFREKTRVPLILVGGIRSYQVAEKLLREGVADYISMSRPLIREPGLINRWKAGDLRKAACISCNNCVEQVKKGEGLNCLPFDEDLGDAFFPQISEMVPASPPHPPGTNYKVSIGLDQWGSSYIPAIKIQLVHNEKISNRIPSFPLGSEDHSAVARAMDDLLRKYKTNP
ncbi:MAG: NADH:flavin oxidoreductase [Syntrophobacteraceae bacterium]|jgi:2,4-dienoyl-CoA reductase-like NADH-dependent reductase (Old Yellow Enzyme family)